MLQAMCRRVVVSALVGYVDKASAFMAAFSRFSDVAAVVQHGNAAAVMNARNRAVIRGRDAAVLIWKIA